MYSPKGEYRLSCLRFLLRKPGLPELVHRLLRLQQQQVTANCRAAERCCSSPAAARSWRHCFSPLPMGSPRGRAPEAQELCPFPGQRRLLGADVMLLGGRRVTTSRNAQSREQHGAEQGSRQSPQLSQPCSQHLEAQDHLGTILCASKSCSQPMLRPRRDFLSHSGTRTSEHCVRVEWCLGTSLMSHPEMGAGAHRHL